MHLALNYSLSLVEAKALMSLQSSFDMLNSLTVKTMKVPLTTSCWQLY